MGAVYTFLKNLRNKNNKRRENMIKKVWNSRWMPVIAILAGLFAAYTVVLLTSPEAMAASSIGYKYVRTITIPGSRVLMNTYEFPLLFKSTLPELRTVANGGHVENTALGGVSGNLTVPADLIFSPDVYCTSKYDFEVTQYDPTTGALTAYVRIPFLEDGKSKTIYLCYGDSTVTSSQENVNGVWPTDYYKAVYHFEESGGTLYDSTANANHASTSGGVLYQVAGKVGYGLEFDGVDDYLVIPHDSSLNVSSYTFAVEVWASPDNFSDVRDPLLRKGIENLDTARWSFSVPDGLLSFSAINGSDYVYCKASSSISVGTYSHLVADKAGGNVLYCYVNGSLVDLGVGDVVKTIQNNREVEVAAHRRYYDLEWIHFFDGRLDEIRIWNRVIFGDKVKMLYNNMANPSGFYSVGPEKESLVLIYPPNRDVVAGNTYTFDIIVKNQVDAIDAYEVLIGADTSQVTIDDIADGGFINSAVEAGTDIDNAAGYGSFGAYSTQADVTGWGTLATFTVTAKTTGNFTPILLDVEMDAGHTSDFVRCDPDFPWDNSSGEVDPYSECDGEVDVFDVMRVAARWNLDCEEGEYPNCTKCDPGYDVDADYDGDCDITVIDIMTVSARWGEVNPNRPLRLQVGDYYDKDGIQGWDDAYHVNEDGANVYNSSTVRLGFDYQGREYFAGFLFRYVPLEYGSVITDARLILDVSYINATEGITVEVFTEDSVNALSTKDFNTGNTIAQRLIDKYPDDIAGYCDALSEASQDYCGLWVEWTIDSTGVVTSPNLAVIIQEAVGRADWDKYDSLVILIRPKPGSASNYAVVEPYDAYPEDAAKLEISWVKKKWSMPTSYGERLPYGALSGFWGDPDGYDEIYAIGAGTLDTGLWEPTSPDDVNIWLANHPDIVAVSGARIDMTNICNDTKVQDYLAGLPLGEGLNDCYAGAFEWYDNYDQIDWVRISPSNEEDGYVGDPDCSRDEGHIWAGESNTDWNCDDPGEVVGSGTDNIPDHLEYVDFVARGYIGLYAASEGALPATGGHWAHAGSYFDPLFIKRVMDFGLGSFMDGLEIHNYANISCWAEGCLEEMTAYLYNEGPDQLESKCQAIHVFENFERYKKRLRKAIILNEDYREVMRKYDSPDTFFYLDPPHYEIRECLYVTCDVDPEELRNFLRTIKGKWILTYNNHPRIRELFKGYEMEVVPRLFSMPGVEKGEERGYVEELLIRNYELVEHIAEW